MNHSVVVKINEIRDDKTHGAGWLSRQAINTMNLAISESQADTATAFVDEIRKVATELIKARPSMISIANYVNQFLHQLILMSQNERRLESVKSLAQSRGNELIHLYEEAVLKSIEHGCEIIRDLDTVITCSYSSTVCETFKMANRKGTNFQVIAAESRADGKAYGEITAEQLKRHRIPVELIPDKDISLHISRANKALVGADSILADGSLINGTPTCKLARAAAEAKIAFYSVCETGKLDVQGCISKGAEPEQGFDRVPPHLITGIITEEGTIRPDQITAHIEKIARLHF